MYFQRIMQALVIVGMFSSQLYAAHGVSIDGKLKYEQGFKSFDYTSGEARKGGKLILHDIGSFDKLNPFTLKGEAPLGLLSLVFEPLADSSLDEPFSQYGLLAEDIEIADDKQSVVFTINRKARFSDGSPVLASDVAYSLDFLKSEAVHPHFNYYYEDVSGYDVLSDQRIRINFKRTNRELHMIAAQLPILSEKNRDMVSSTPSRVSLMTAPIASGPYFVKDVQLGKSITYTKNP